MKQPRLLTKTFRLSPDVVKMIQERTVNTRMSQGAFLDVCVREHVSREAVDEREKK